MSGNPNEASMVSAGRLGHPHPPNNNNNNNNHTKRPRISSPACVMNEEIMSMDTQDYVEFATPPSKRQRPEFGGNLVQQLQVHVSPEMPSVAMESMERDDQYGLQEWWKMPPAAPQLSESSTLHSNNHTNDVVVGCNSCQRLFAPPKVSSQPEQANTLLNYFACSKPKTTPQQQQGGVDLSSCRCTFCERSTCNNCLRSCEACQHNFCILCSTRAYLPTSSRQEQTVCLDCASMLDIPRQSGDVMMEG